MQAGTYHILIVRDKNDMIRAFHSQCRHRGTKLDEHSVKRSNAITCPYHNWTYNLKGDLIAAPQKDDFRNLEFERYALHPAKVAVFKQMIFVHPNPEADSLSSWLGSMPGKMGAYVHLLFPNIGITETESDWSTIQILPMAPDRTIIEVRTRTVQASTLGKVAGWFSGSEDTSDDLIRLSDVENPLTSGDFMMEDIFVCEKLQESITSPKFKTGPMAMGFEDTIIQYQTHILNALNHHI